MTVAYVGLGSNLGDREAALRDAIAALADEMRIIASSSVYETAPWGDTDQPRFLNCCVGAETGASAPTVLAALKTIETRLGRTPARRWGPRRIDLDLLLYGAERVRTPELVVPHPRLTERAFVLVPLAEIAPGAPIPGSGGTVGDALARLSREAGDVRRAGPPIVPPAAR